MYHILEQRAEKSHHHKDYKVNHGNIRKMISKEVLMKFFSTLGSNILCFDKIYKEGRR